MTVQTFEGRVAVVTGASSGIGLAMAQAFVREGMKVVLADIDAARLRHVTADLRSAGGDVLDVETDVSRLEDVERLAERACGAYGKVHVVCNNAGVTRHTGEAVWELGDKDWQWLLGVNVWGIIHGMRVFIPHLLAHGEEGHVVNTSSLAGLGVGGGAYAVTKHAVVSLSENLHVELARRSALVGVSCLCPGLVATEIVESEERRPARLRDGQREETDEQRSTRERVARFTREHGAPPSRVAELVLEGIRERRFYLLGDDPPMFHGIDERVRSRMENILARGSPVEMFRRETSSKE